MKYKRILLKLSGEALMGKSKYGIDPVKLTDYSNEINEIIKLGIEVAVVIGGGNIFRGVNLANAGMNRVTGDHIGMLATVMNALAISDAFVRHNIPCQVMSGFPIGGGVCDPVDHNKAKNALTQGNVVIFSAGTGNPCFTTDTGAALRAVEIEADIIFKATKVDCIYSNDPLKDSNAVKFQSFNEDIIKDHPQKSRLFKSSISKNNIEIINELAKETGIEWFCTPMTIDAVELLNPFVKRFKIREYDSRELIENKITDLFENLLKTGKQIMISTEKSPTNCKFFKHPQVQWLYCVPKYPCNIND